MSNENKYKDIFIKSLAIDDKKFNEKCLSWFKLYGGEFKKLKKQNKKNTPIP